MPEDFRLQPLDPGDTNTKNPELVHTDGVVKARFRNYLENESKKLKKKFINGWKIWHHQDTTFNTPKVYLDIVIKNPAFTSSPEGHVLTRIYAYLLNDYFAPYLYQDRHQFVNYSRTDSLRMILYEFDKSEPFRWEIKALLAENFWQLRVEPDGLVLSMWGFSDSIPKVANRMAELIADYEPEPGMLVHAKNHPYNIALNESMIRSVNYGP